MRKIIKISVKIRETYKSNIVTKMFISMLEFDGFQMIFRIICLFK